MVLSIDTTSRTKVIIQLREDNRIIAQRRFLAARQQAEKLLVNIDRLLQEQNLDLSILTKIEVANQGDSFTALRIGVITANALAYALKIPVVATTKDRKKLRKFKGYSLVEPIYSHEAIIGPPKK